MKSKYAVVQLLKPTDRRPHFEFVAEFESFDSFEPAKGLAEGYASYDKKGHSSWIVVNLSKYPYELDTLDGISNSTYDYLVRNKGIAEFGNRVISATC